MLAALTLFSMTIIGGMSAAPAKAAEVKEDSSTGDYETFGSQTLLESAGITYAAYMKWLEDHDDRGEFPDYYLGTPYAGYFPDTPFETDDYRTPNGEEYSEGDVPPSYAPYNDLQAFKDACTENTIAIMIEPVQGEGGVHPATMEFMKGLREFCDEKGMLLLIDEVQTGWCRTGKVMSFMHYGIKPDIVSMAKALGGGMPIGAICAKAEVAKAFTAGSHGTTFGGHPVSCAAALAQVNELLDRDLAGNAEKVGNCFMEKLKTLPHVKEVRGQGLLVGVEFDDSVNAVDVKHECLHRHLLITAIGSHVIRMVPPLIITEEDCDKAYDIIKTSVEALG